MATDILLVDDDEDLRLALSQLLRDEGYEVMELASAGTLVEVIESHRPGLILLDLTMAGFDVADAGRDLADRGLLATSRLIVLSGRDDAREIAREHGFHGTLPKPFELGHLLSVVESELSQRTGDRTEHADPFHP